MSKLYIRRPVEQGPLLSTSHRTRLGEIQPVHTSSLHLSLLSRRGIGTIAMQRMAEIMNEQPESASEALETYAKRAVLVGHKALTCSVALEIDDPDQTLLQEAEYFRSLKEVGGREPFFGHVTLMRGLPYEQAKQFTERLNRKLPQETITLQPAIISLNYDDPRRSDKVA